MLGGAFGERRLNPNRSLIWRQIRAAIDHGILPASVLTDVTIKAEGPSLVTRDTDKEASTNKAYLDMGIKSKQTISAELGLDYETESKNLKLDPATPPQQGAPGGGAGAPPAQDDAGAAAAPEAPAPDAGQEAAPTF